MRRGALLVSVVLHLSALTALLSFGLSRRLAEPPPPLSISVLLDAAPASLRRLPPLSDAQPAPPPDLAAPAEPPLADASAAPPLAATPTDAPLAVAPAEPPWAPTPEASTPVAPIEPSAQAALPPPSLVKPEIAPAADEPRPRTVPQAIEKPVRPAAAPAAKPRPSPSPRPAAREAAPVQARPPQPAREASEAAQPAPVARAPAPPAEATPLVPPRPISGVASNHQPSYPDAALRRGVEGRVILRVDVSAGGEAANVSVLRGSGNTSLDEAALAAVRAWRFIPASRNGVAIAGVADVPIDFRIAR